MSGEFYLNHAEAFAAEFAVRQTITGRARQDTTEDWKINIYKFIEERMADAQ